MASGYESLMYRLSGVLPSTEPSPRDNIDSLKNALRGYFLDDSLDEVSLDLSFKNFAIPALLTLLYDYVGSDPHRIRLNEYLYRRLSLEVDTADHADCVFGVMSLIVDAGSIPDVPLDVDYLESFMYEFFPGLETFLRQVSPTVRPFTTAEIKLDKFADYLASIQVKLFSCFLF